MVSKLDDWYSLDGRKSGRRQMDSLAWAIKKSMILISKKEFKATAPPITTPPRSADLIYCYIKLSHPPLTSPHPLLPSLPPPSDPLTQINRRRQIICSLTVMSMEERPLSSSSTSSTTSCYVVDPLLKDLNEKKQNFRRNVVSLAAELKEVRSRLACQEQSFVRETLTRQEAESKAKKMEEEINKLQKNLEVKNGELQVSALNTEKYVKQLDDLTSQLSATQATADASAASAQSAQLQCFTLVKELDEKNSSLKEHEVRVNKLGEQLDLLQKDLQARESSLRQLKDEVVRIEHDIMQSLAKSGANKDCELRKILDEVSPKNIEKMNKLLTNKDEEITILRDEIRIMSAHWKLKTKELESQLEKHRRADQELKKRIMKLEFCLQEARTQTRKLKRMGEWRDKAIKELRDQLATKQVGTSSNNNQNFWDTSGFKIVVSMSMLVLVLFSKR
ncbi:hypothetical protein K7X08_009263 [Anisodus acutangulus]|uniref:Uncharacterized protein n=1 Tax=Anisodus acutangulus TaxID=402998 RepID=A0A9Q1RTG3_9SOLA|nr:hypothetical protein K7X08_009263 [Anisodus acutangulus]